MSYYTYLASDKDGKVLYVGRATRKEVWRRFAEHAKRKGAAWMQEAKHIIVYEHATHESMRWHEWSWWHSHRPPYNTRDPGYVEGQVVVHLIALTCYKKDEFGRWHEQKGWSVPSVGGNN